MHMRAGPVDPGVVQLSVGSLGAIAFPGYAVTGHVRFSGGLGGSTSLLVETGLIGYGVEPKFAATVGLGWRLADAPRVASHLVVQAGIAQYLGSQWMPGPSDHPRHFDTELPQAMALIGAGLDVVHRASRILHPGLLVVLDGQMGLVDWAVNEHYMGDRVTVRNRPLVPGFTVGLRIGVATPPSENGWGAQIESGLAIRCLSLKTADYSGFYTGSVTPYLVLFHIHIGRESGPPTKHNRGGQQ